jgi:hypothetical protein
VRLRWLKFRDRVYSRIAEVEEPVQVVSPTLRADPCAELQRFVDLSGPGRSLCRIAPFDGERRRQDEHSDLPIKSVERMCRRRDSDHRWPQLSFHGEPATLLLLLLLESRASAARLDLGLDRDRSPVQHEASANGDRHDSGSLSGRARMDGGGLRGRTGLAAARQSLPHESDDRLQIRLHKTLLVVATDNGKRRFAAPLLRADDGARTHDPQLGKLMLYQLSYVRALGL